MSAKHKFNGNSIPLVVYCVQLPLSLMAGEDPAPATRVLYILWLACTVQSNPFFYNYDQLWSTYVVILLGVDLVVVRSWLGGRS
jgi:hypothetical protein